MPPAPDTVAPQHPEGLRSAIVTGYVDDGLGIGVVARGYARALRDAGLEVAIHGVEVPNRTARRGDLQDREFPRVGSDATADMHLCCVHPPELAHFRAIDRPLPTGRLRVAGWSYEVDPAPEAWREVANDFDDIWAPSDYAASVIAKSVDVPVAGIVPPVELGKPAGPYDPDGPVLVLADALSDLRRKNVTGAVLAYRTAVRPSDGRRLIVKLWNASYDADGLAEVHSAAEGRSDIEILDCFLSPTEHRQLLASASCLLSLHRAEGLGLAIFEVLALGIPVVCTEGTGPGPIVADVAHLVRAQPEAIGPRGGPYPPDARWLEPDTAHAERQLARVLADPEAAAATVRDLAPAVLERFTHARVGAICWARLAWVGDRARDPERAGAVSAIQDPLLPRRLPADDRGQPPDGDDLPTRSLAATVEAVRLWDLDQLVRDTAAKCASLRTENRELAAATDTQRAELLAMREEHDAAALELREAHRAEILTLRDELIAAEARTGTLRAGIRRAEAERLQFELERNAAVHQIEQERSSVLEELAYLRALAAHREQMLESATWRIGHRLGAPMRLVRRLLGRPV